MPCTVGRGGRAVQQPGALTMKRFLLIISAVLVCSTVLAEAFLTTPGGALYRDLKPGSGEPVVAGDVVSMHFIGWLARDGGQGREFFNTRAHGRPVSFVVGTDWVIKGWNEGVTGMREGGKRLLKLPPALAYGDAGVDDMVPPGTAVILIIEVVSLEKRTQ